MFRATLLRHALRCTPARPLPQPARRAIHQHVNHANHANPERSFAEAFLFMTGCLTLEVGAGKLLWAACETYLLKYDVKGIQLQLKAMEKQIQEHDRELSNIRADYELSRRR